MPTPFKSINNLLNPAGGLRYHLRAWINHKRWRDYQANLSQWLMSWDVPRQGLILVGPSAGYNLPATFLCSFKNLVALEIDPLARFLFQRRLPNVKIHWAKEDLLIEGEGKKLANFLGLYPDRPVLFCNILGQVALLNQSEQSHYDEEKEKLFLQQFTNNLKDTLSTRPWASFHDRLSGELLSEIQQRDYSARPSDDHLVRDFYPKMHGQLLAHHLPDLFLPAKAFSYLQWPLTSSQHHLIELYR